MSQQNCDPEPQGTAPSSPLANLPLETLSTLGKESITTPDPTDQMETMLTDTEDETHRKPIKPFQTVADSAMLPSAFSNVCPKETDVLTPLKLPCPEKASGKAEASPQKKRARMITFSNKADETFAVPSRSLKRASTTAKSIACDALSRSIVNSLGGADADPAGLKALSTATSEKLSYNEAFNIISNALSTSKNITVYEALNMITDVAHLALAVDDSEKVTTVDDKAVGKAVDNKAVDDKAVNDKAVDDKAVDDMAVDDKDTVMGSPVSMSQVATDSE